MNLFRRVWDLACASACNLPSIRLSVLPSPPTIVKLGRKGGDIQLDPLAHGLHGRSRLIHTSNFFLIMLIGTRAAHKHFAGIFVFSTPTRATVVVAQTGENFLVLWCGIVAE